MVDRNELTLHGISLTSADSGTPHIHHAWRTWPGATVIAGVERLDRAGLCRRIQNSRADGGTHLWRINSPLSIAHEHLVSRNGPLDWDSMAEWMASFSTARDWRRAMRVSDRKELRRDCDRVHAAPLAPTNLRLFKQTWMVITQVARPLRLEGIRIEPCAGSIDSRVTICESNATSVLVRGGVPASGYKGEGTAPQSRRESIITWLRTRNIGIGPDLAQRAVEETHGGTLDALLMTTDPQHTVAPAGAVLESWIY